MSPIIAQDAIVSLACGLEHVVVVDGDGEVFAWGDNDSGQLGIGDLGATRKAHRVALPTSIRQVAAGQSFSLALSSDRQHIFSWGDNSKGELGIGRPGLSQANKPRQVVLPLQAGQSIAAIARGGNGGFALLSSGEVYGWGANDHGQAGRNPETAIVGKPSQIVGLSHVAMIAAGDHQTLALKADGSVLAFGANRYGQLGPGGPGPKVRSATSTPVRVSGLPKIVAIAAGGESSYALDAKGDVWAWGRNAFGQLGRGTIDADDGPHATPTRVQGLSNIVSIESQGPFALASDASGNVYGWGFNQNGESGNGELVNTGTPRLVLPGSELGRPVALSAGHWFGYAYSPVTGRAYGWGRNSYGELLGAGGKRDNQDPLDLGRLPVCFVGGTRIRTARGDIAVESLAVGDRVETVGGAYRPIRWLGHRVLRPREMECPSDAWPVRILAGAFGSRLPTRDLYLSPGHPVLVDAGAAGEHLVPVMCLVNGTTVSRVPVETVTYWHVELDAHDILYAEGLPAESYLDCGDRDFFGDGSVPLLLGPDLVAPGLAARCRPVALVGGVVEAERRRLDAVFATRLADACAWPEARTGA